MGEDVGMRRNTSNDAMEMNRQGDKEGGRPRGNGDGIDTAETHAQMCLSNSCVSCYLSMQACSGLYTPYRYGTAFNIFRFCLIMVNNS